MTSFAFSFFSHSRNVFQNTGQGNQEEKSKIPKDDDTKEIKVVLIKKIKSCGCKKSLGKLFQ